MRYRFDVKILLSVIFGSIGGMFFLTGIMMNVNHAIFLREAAETTALVTYAGGDGTEIEFYAGGELIQTRISESSSSMRPGRKVDIWYDPADPYRARSNVLGVLGIVFSGVGGCFLLAVVILILIVWHGKRRALRLIIEGTCVLADIVAVEEQRHIRYNSRHPWIIVCEWRDPATGFGRVFRSEYFKEHPGGALGHYGIRALPVYLDERGSHYYMDTSAIG